MVTVLATSVTIPPFCSSSSARDAADRGLPERLDRGGAPHPAGRPADLRGPQGSPASRARLVPQRPEGDTERRLLDGACPRRQARRRPQRGHGALAAQLAGERRHLLVSREEQRSAGRRAVHHCADQHSR